MSQPPLYTASVPVFLHYIDRIEALLDRAELIEGLLDRRLAPDMFTCGQQMVTALSFALRTAYPLAGRAVPRSPEGRHDAEGIRMRIGAARSALRALDPEEFAGAETRMIVHRAGFSELSQDGAAFLHLFGMPNFLFHAAMAFAVLRAEGVGIGKADFDGQHDYPPGFRF